MQMQATRALLLLRHGLVFFDDQSEGAPLPVTYVKAIELELAALGYMPTARLAARMSRLAAVALDALQSWLRTTLAAAVGGGQAHVPLFRSFPDDIPTDTAALWWQKVLVHYLQAQDQACLFCKQIGTTHVLRPCAHVVCDHCFDGASYSACPVCEHAVDRSSPFFLPAATRDAKPERVRMKLLDAGEDLDAAARAMFAALCERKQPMSPDDKAALVAIARDFGDRVLPWLPETIPVRENTAVVFGTLFQACGPAHVLPHATRYLTTATDVLRLVASYSGADPSLERQTLYQEIECAPQPGPTRWWGRVAELLGKKATTRAVKVKVPVGVYRFKVGKLSRPLRRALLAILDGLHPDALVEDMLRHRSYWVWLGEFLHPHEHAKRFPSVARGFLAVRGRDHEGNPAPKFRNFYSKLDEAAQNRDVEAMLALLSQRPGELARRFDHTLRIVGDDVTAATAVMKAFEACAAKISTPVLLTLRGVLPTRRAPHSVRVYWPKGVVTKGVAEPDKRPPLPADVIGGACRIIDDELLRRFAEQPAFDAAIIDRALRSIITPFNEKTASKAAVALPRGSSMATPPGKIARMFVHWCEPAGTDKTTDIDLSVGFYGAAWNYLGVCSYYELTCDLGGTRIATSAGDLRNAPPPDGATEFVDIDREVARANGVRYAVMVVNNYIGLPFVQLDRAFAGLMFRDDPKGVHFDPRTVELRFDLTGDSGVYMPLVFDLETGSMHWLDVYSKGHVAFNNLESSRLAIMTVCPNLITYFASGVRPSMFELAALHAAARCREVFVRGEVPGANLRFVRGEDERAPAFLARLLAGTGGTVATELPRGPVLAALDRGDLELADGSTCYALRRQHAGATIAASALIA